MSDTARERYSQIMQDVERLVLDHSEHITSRHLEFINLIAEFS